MDPSTARSLLPTVSTVIVVAVGALVTRVLHAGMPPGPVTAVVAGVLTAGAVVAALVRRRATRRRGLDAEWAAVEPHWRRGSGYPER